MSATIGPAPQLQKLPEWDSALPPNLVWKETVFCKPKGRAKETVHAIERVLKDKTKIFTLETLRECENNVNDIKARVVQHARNNLPFKWIHWEFLKGIIEKLCVWRASYLFSGISDRIKHLKIMVTTKTLLKPLVIERRVPQAQVFEDLKKALQEDQEETLLQLLDSHKISVNIRIENTKTLLQLAAEKGSLKVVKALLAKGALPEYKDCTFTTPLHAAVANGHVAIVEELLATRLTDVNACDNKGRTALSLAVQANNRPLIDLLRSRGATESKPLDFDRFV